MNKMSLCIRSIPSKLSSFVGSRNQMLQLDRRLTSLISSSTNYSEIPSVSARRITSRELKLVPLKCGTTTTFDNLNLKCYSAIAHQPKQSASLPEENQCSREKKSTDNEDQRGPTQSQLEHVYNTLKNDLPILFVSSLNYRIYHPDIEFINNYQGTIIKGRNAYIKKILYLRVSGHLMYAYVKFDVLKITIHPEDNTIRVRWRIRGLSGLKVAVYFWKFRWLKVAETLQQLETWHDGFSTYFVGPDGLVHKHVADKMMPDDEKVPLKDKTNIAAKLAA